MMNWEDLAWTVSGCFSGAAILLSIFHIYRHLKNWTVPGQQRYIVRLLLMVPIYAVDSWLGVRFRQYALYFDFARDCYEAYVLYQFFALLISYINASNPGNLENILTEKPPISHPFPFCCLPRIKPGPLFLIYTKQFILQYVVIKPLMGIVAAILQMNDLFKEGEFDPRYGYLYVTVIVNISVTLSLYFLVLFYMATSEELKPFSPVSKFLCVKAVLFFSFWQSVLIGILSYFDVIQQVGDWKKEEIAMGFQDFLICIEMFLLSVAHGFVFSARPYYHAEKKAWISPQDVLVEPIKNLKHIVDQRDLVSDFSNAYNPHKVIQARKDHKELKKRLKKADVEIDLMDVTSINSPSTEKYTDNIDGELVPLNQSTDEKK